MTQFRAIPIEWGLSEEKYFKFLMWVSFRATFKGWDRCDALQVTFTVREAASHFGVSVSTVSSWITAAKKSGLLLPTNQSATERGKGEVYNLGGDVLMTVKTAEQDPNKIRTRSEQPSVDLANAFVDLANNDRTSSEQAPNVNKVYSPDSPKTSSPSRARSSKKREPLSPPGEFLADLATIAKDWPRRSDYKGAVASVSVLSRPVDVWERIVKFVPEADRSLAIRCALLYLDELDARERGVKGLIPNVCAMTNFYGEAAKWKSMIAKVEERRCPS